MSRDYLGCGRTPGRHYDAAGIVALHGGGDGARLEARELYRFGACGGMWDTSQRLWPWCPRWWTRFASSRASAAADAVQDAAARLESGLPVRGLTAEGESLVAWLGRVRSWLAEDARQRAAEESS